MKIVLNAIILMFSVICIIAFLLFVFCKAEKAYGEYSCACGYCIFAGENGENITPETHFLSRETINAVVFGWLGLYLLRLYWSYSQKESGVTKDELYERHIPSGLPARKERNKD